MKRFCIFHKYQYTGFYLDFNQKKIFLEFCCKRCGKKKIRSFKGE